jgi:hypothetical protein
MDRIRHASSTIINENRDGKHLVSLKNIIFEGSQRKLSALHPSQQNNPNKKIGKIASGTIENINEKIPSNRQMELNHINNITSDEPMMSEDQLKNILKKKGANSAKESSNFEIPEETKVGTRLKNEIQKNIISMVLLVLISIPLLDGNTWYENVTSYEKSLDELIFFLNYNAVEFDAQLRMTISLMSLKPDPIVYIFVPYNSTCC